MKILYNGKYFTNTSNNKFAVKNNTNYDVLPTLDISSVANSFYKGIHAGTNITIASTATGITINSSGGGSFTGATNGITGATNGLSLIGKKVKFGGSLTGDTLIKTSSTNLVITGSTGTITIGETQLGGGFGSGFLKVNTGGGYFNNIQMIANSSFASGLTTMSSGGQWSTNLTQANSAVGLAMASNYSTTISASRLTNNTILDALYITQVPLNSALTGNTGFGVGISLGMPNKSAIYKYGRIGYVYKDATNATTNGQLQFGVAVNGGATPTNILLVDRSGATYTADYSSLYSKRSIPDVAYVTGLTSGGAYQSKASIAVLTGTTLPATYQSRTSVNTLTGTTLPATYNSKVAFNSYTASTAPSLYQSKASVIVLTGTTLPATYLTKANFTIFSGATGVLPRDYATKTKLNLYTGTTAPATFQSKSSIVTLTGTTIPATYATKAKLNLYTGTTAPALFATKANFDTYTGTTAPVTYLSQYGQVLPTVLRYDNSTSDFSVMDSSVTNGLRLIGAGVHGGTFTLSSSSTQITSGYYNGNVNTITGAWVAPNYWAFGAISIGAAGAGGASMNVASSGGVSPTSPVDGDIWYDGTHLYIRIAGVTKTIV